MVSTEKYILIKAAESDIEEKKSHFICRLERVGSEEEAKAFIEAVRKEHYNARHNCFAMRIGLDEPVFERSSDDGEPSGTAGRPMLDILKSEGLFDICAVVTRYFGGTLLGTGGLVRAYSDSLKEAIRLSEKALIKTGYRLKVSCGYSEAERIKRQAFSDGIPIIEEEYLELCRLILLVPYDKRDAFLEKVTQLSLGKAASEIISKTEYFGEGRPQVYESTKVQSNP